MIGVVVGTEVIGSKDLLLCSAGLLGKWARGVLAKIWLLMLLSLLLSLLLLLFYLLALLIIDWPGSDWGRV